jgi:hypothetical protein
MLILINSAPHYPISSKMKTSTNFFKLVILLFILSGNAAFAQVCSNPGGVIYSLSNAGGIYPITVSNASVGSVVNSTYMVLPLQQLQ